MKGVVPRPLSFVGLLLLLWSVFRIMTPQTAPRVTHPVLRQVVQLERQLSQLLCSAALLERGDTAREAARLPEKSSSTRETSAQDARCAKPTAPTARCAEGQLCVCAGCVRFGSGSAFTEWRAVSPQGNIHCSVATFGRDPHPAAPKHCECRAPSGSPNPQPSVQPVSEAPTDGPEPLCSRRASRNSASKWAVFKDAVDILNRLDVPFALHGGTILNYYRDCELTGSDIDVAMALSWWASPGAQPALKRALLAAGFEQRVLGVPFEPGYEESWTRDEVTIDFFSKVELPGAYKYFLHLEGNLNACFVKYQRYAKVSFDGLQVRIPVPLSTALASFYGDGWRVRQTRWGWNVHPFNIGWCKNEVPAVVKAIAAARPVTGGLPPQPCKQTVAVLISGQAQRFAYQDQSGPLVAVPTTSPACTVAVDVFIALHEGRMSKPFTGGATGLPYTSDEPTIRRWLVARGARSVVMRVVDDDHMATMERNVRSRLSSWNGTADVQGMIRKFTEDRWRANLRMLYLRHLSFLMSSDREYAIYTYWREDNHALQPIDIESYSRSLLREWCKGCGHILTDAWCGWGSYSDKAYVTDHAGAVALFDPTGERFASKMVDWVDFASHRETGDPTFIFQTETFLEQKVFQGAKVNREDLHRTEVRHVDGQLCVTPKYWDCAPELKTRKTLKKCA